MKNTLLCLLLILSLLFVPAVNAADLSYVTDEADLLTSEEWAKLESIGGEIAQEYDCEVYIITVDDYSDYGSGDVFEVAYQLYHEYDLGKGTERNGILLLLSMEYRDYALFVYGDNAEYAFDDYGLQKLEDKFLDDLQYDDWYGGLQDYMSTCRNYLEKASEGNPVRQSRIQFIPIVIGISLLIALIVCSILKMQMKSVFKKAEADSYATEGSFHLTNSHDLYTHTTTTRTKINKESGSSSRSGGGGSGRSGKF